MSAVEAAQRFTRKHPCPICGGGDDFPRGKGRRCSGFASADGRFAYCSREELAHELEPQATEPTTYRHLLAGDCWCGDQHGVAASMNGGGMPVATYDYVDEAGELLFQVCRFEPKRFLQRRPDRSGGWIWKLANTRRVPHRLPSVLAAVEAGEEIWIVEGEKDVEALERAGVHATCNPGGAGKWRAEYAEHFAGARVVIVPDLDVPGEEHARKVAASLEGIAASIDVRRPCAGKDAADHLAAGYGIDDFEPSSLEAVGDADASCADASTLEPATEPIVFVTLREFLELDFPQAESLVGHVRGGTNLLPRFGWVMPWGREGSSKTTLLVDLLFHAVAGQQWLHYPIGRPLRVVAIVNEGVPGGFQDKLREKHELWEGNGDPILDGLAVYASPWGEFTFRDERMFSHLRDFVDDFGADYVAGDPLHTLGPEGSGLPAETEAFKHLLRDFGIWESVGLITAHHTNKAGLVSGDWARHPDTVLLVEKDGRYPRTKLTLQKARPADPAELGAPQLLEWIVETKGYRLIETEPEKVGDANRDRVLEAIRDGLRGAAEIAERAGLSPKTVKRHVQALADNDLVRLEQGPNRALLAFPRGAEDDDDDPEPLFDEEDA